MDSNTELRDDSEGGGESDLFFIEGSSSSEGEAEIRFSSQKRKNNKQRASSPPILLMFNNTARQGCSRSPTSSLDLEDEQEGQEDSDQPIEEWMILGREEQVGDSSIQLNINYCTEEDFEDADSDVTVKDTWAVSEKDKCGAPQSLPIRYFVPGFLICNICNRTGHLAKSCYNHKKVPTCVLCGIQGHIQRDCPGRPCSSCGLPSHHLRPCERPPVWNQHCQRCGMAGHLSDVCPDTWRQYHLTIRLEVPVRPQTVQTPKDKKCPAHCYNCSKRGHYGYECTRRRMVTGTFPVLPYVCHYDTMQDVLQRHTSMKEGVKELVGAGSLPFSVQQQLSEPAGESNEENRPVQGRSRMKQEAFSQSGRRKTWPERRRERREVKRLRREAQARREGGLLGRSWRNFDDEMCPADPLRSTSHSHKQSTPPPQKKRRDEAGGRSRKSREAARWKKRGGMKRGDLYPHSDIDTGSENLLSPKQRVRHRRR